MSYGKYGPFDPNLFSDPDRLQVGILLQFNVGVNCTEAPLEWPPEWSEANRKTPSGWLIEKKPSFPSSKTPQPPSQSQECWIPRGS
jgi:hypothetical protein